MLSHLKVIHFVLLVIQYLTISSLTILSMGDYKTSTLLSLQHLVILVWSYSPQILLLASDQCLD